MGVSWIVLSILGFICRHTTEPLLAKTRQLRDSARQHAREREEEYRRLEGERRAEEQRRLQQAQPVPPRSERAKQAIEEAKRDFEIDCELVKSLQLPSEEREAALMKARQKLVRRLDEILQ